MYKNMKPVTDHLGRKFSSVVAMCSHYKISCDTYLQRRKRGWTVERALTTPARRRRENIEPVDHLGNRYSDINSMCAFYLIPVNTFLKRYKYLGWTLKDALTKPIRPRA